MRSAALLIFLVTSFVAAQDIKIVHDFEQPQELKRWEFKNKSGELSDLHATHGQKSLRISANEYMFWYNPVKDWSAYDSMDIDIFVEGTSPVAMSTLIGDEAWQKANTYWNRHNGTFNLKPGVNTVSISVNGLYRGEAGSRGNDLKSNIDPKTISRLDFGFQGEGSLYLDNMRLVKESRPAGILAFDFGPESQAVFPGFTPISWNTVVGKNGAKAGLRHPQWGPNSARDDTFPTRLYQDYVAMDGTEFIAEAPAGKYHVWIVFDDLGYWGGEQARFQKRWVECGGKTVWSEERGESGPSDYLFKFEKMEPKPGDNLWDLYVGGLFQPKRFDAEASGGTLNLAFRGDAGNACKVAALIIYPDSIKDEAEKWISEVEARNRKEFESRAIYMGPKSADAGVQKITVGYPALEQDVSVFDSPGNPTGKLSRNAARGQRISYTFAVQAPKDFTGTVSYTVSDLTGPGQIPASEIDLRYVQHAAQRGYNNIAYTIKPERLVRLDGATLTLSGGLTRQFWITVHVPVDAKPGTYTGQVVLKVSNSEQALPLSLEVLDLTLDEPDYVIGFFGTGIPPGLPQARQKTAWRDLFKIQKENGMNTISGGPNIPFDGFDAGGAPKLDFSACDEFMHALKDNGFTKQIMMYGGPGMVVGLHGNYVIGEEGRAWEKKTGKPLGELLKTVWGAVKAHAEKEAWLPIAYGFTDEPRVYETAHQQVELMKLYHEAVPYLKIGGSYSVNWAETKDPFDAAVREIFKTLDWSSLNLHSQIDLDKAKEFGHELYIYNQGRSRFSFGAYQWAEMHKGVHGRIEWHLLALHGYQFFDLDGREPDTAMINWGRDEIIPTIHLARCREGSDDFRFAVTLWNLAQSKKDRPEAQAAIAWLEEVNRVIGISKREPPAGFMDDETFRNTCIDHIRKIQTAR